MFKRIIQTSLLLLLALMLFTGCAKNGDIVFRDGSAVSLDYDLGSTLYYGYFGQYYVQGKSTQ